MIIRDVILEGSNLLKKKKILSASLDSELLMSNLINKDRNYLLMNDNDSIKSEIYHKFIKLIERRSLNVPISYIINKKFFWKNEFFVNQNVLIPRPDTEIIVEQVLKLTDRKEKIRVLEVGVGSGCLLLSILDERRRFEGVGIDKSVECCKITKINAKKLKLKNHLKIFKTSIDNFNFGKYDLIISNPPYISKNEIVSLDEGVRNFEPKLALDGGYNGLCNFISLIKKSRKLLNNRGKLILEIGYKQKKSVSKILIEQGFFNIRCIKDYANNDRCIVSMKG
jgi:release factor glutamine methyltransferase